MKYKTAYDTTMGRNWKTDKIAAAVKAAMISSNLSTCNLGTLVTGSVRPCFITGNNSNAEIPALIHPYLFENYRGTDYIVTDVRLFRGVNDSYASDEEFENTAKNKSEYKATKARGAITALWVGGSQDLLKSQLNFAGSVYASWLSSAISRSLAIDPQEQRTLTAISLYFWYQLFTDDISLEGDHLETAVVHTIKITKLPAKEVYDLFKKLGGMKSINDYCAKVVEVMNNIRLRDLNTVLLLTAVRNTWYGINRVELIQAALEHPPTFMSIVYSAMADKTYKTSQLYSVVENAARVDREASNRYMKNYAMLVFGALFTAETIDNSDVLGYKPEDIMEVMEGDFMEEPGLGEEIVIPDQVVGEVVFPAYKD